MKHPDLNALLQSEPEAKRYYDALPDYVREQINTRPAVAAVMAGYDTPDHVEQAVAYETATDEEKNYASVLAHAIIFRDVPQYSAATRAVESRSATGCAQARPNTPNAACRRKSAGMYIKPWRLRLVISACTAAPMACRALFSTKKTPKRKLVVSRMPVKRIA